MYGPNAGKNNGINYIIDNFLKTNQLNYKGKKIAARKYIHVEDACLACIKALSKLLGISLKISDYQQHAISSGADASAAAYIEITIDNKSFWGIGINSNTVAASFEAIMNGIKKSFS